MEREVMLCGLCKKEVHPLDAHMGRVNDELDVFHVDCWNEFYKNKMQNELMQESNRIQKQWEMQTPEYQLAKAQMDAQMEEFKCAKE